MSLLLTIASATKSGNQTTGGGGDPGGGTYFAPIQTKTWIDDGYYNGFPMGEQAADGTLWKLFKPSAAHADAGILTLAKSTNGGNTLTFLQVKVNGSTVNSFAHSFFIYKSGAHEGRKVIFYQTDGTYQKVRWAYSDSNDENFTYGGEFDFGAGYTSSPSPVKMRLQPGGTELRFAYYRYGTGSNPAEIGFLKSLDYGATFSQGPVIFSNGGTGFGDNKGHEFDWLPLDDAGLTGKQIAIVRNTDAVPYMFYFSSDNGDTWTTDLVTEDNPGAHSRHYIDFGAYTNQAPPHLALFDGLVYLVTGYRDYGAGPFAIQYKSATPANAYLNSYYDWSSIATTLTADQNDVNFGYPITWEGKDSDVATRELWFDYYNVSPLATNGLGTPRCLCAQQKLLAP